MKYPPPLICFSINSKTYQNERGIQSAHRYIIGYEYSPRGAFSRTGDRTDIHTFPIVHNKVSPARVDLVSTIPDKNRPYRTIFDGFIITQIFRPCQ